MTRIRLTFWTLAVVTVGAVGLVSRAAGWPASPVVGATLATAGLIAVVAGGLALRIAIVVARPARTDKQERP